MATENENYLISGVRAMTGYEEIEKLLANHKEILGITSKIGNRHVLSGFSNMEVVLLTSYLLESEGYDLLNGNSDTEAFFKRVYSQFGGDLSHYKQACEEAKKSGYVGLSLETGSAIEVNFRHSIPYLSAYKSIEKLEELLGRYTGIQRRIIKAGEVFTAEKKFTEFLTKDILPTETIKLLDTYIGKKLLSFLLLYLMGIRGL
ncbi:MAG: hypothetical protein QW393_04145 [Candidatus Micrarchaeaceae archaeon]